MIPTPPREITGRVIESSPEKTRKLSGNVIEDLGDLGNISARLFYCDLRRNA